MARWKPVLHEPPPCRIFCVALFDDLQRFVEVKRRLESQFGSIDYSSEAIEIGALPLSGTIPRRHARMVSFERPAGREELVDLKKRTLSIEGEFQAEGHPLVQLDIGYVAPSSVVRAHLLDEPHRVYLYSGVYGESLLHYDRFSFRPFPHTEEFYCQKEILLVFNDLRLILTGGKGG